MEMEFSNPTQNTLLCIFILCVYRKHSSKLIPQSACFLEKSQILRRATFLWVVHFT